MDNDRRKHEERRETFTFPHEHCEEDCPVAIRNSERIATLFIRVDEMKTDVKSAVKWKNFMWIIGILLTILGTVNTLIFNNYNKDRVEVLTQLHIIAESVQDNQIAINTSTVRFNSHMKEREYIIEKHRLDHGKLDNLLNELHSDLKVLNRFTGHKHMLDEGK